MNLHLYEEIKDVETLIKDTIQSSEMKITSMTTKDPHTKHMKKDTKNSDMLNDYRKSQDEEEFSYRYIVSSPIHIIVLETIQVLSKILDLMYSATSLYASIDVVSDNDLIIYVGIAIATLCIF